MDDQYVLNDEGHWVLRSVEERRAAQQGILYANLGKSGLPTKSYKSANDEAATCWYPYSGIDTKKWPNTFKTLLLLYYSADWWTGGKTKEGPYKSFLNSKE